MTALLNVYAGLMRAAAPIMPLYLKKRAKAGKEDPARLPERYGKPSRPRPDGPLIWIHGASVGETLAALPIINWMLGKDETAHVLVTSGTVTSAEMLETRLPARAFHQYLPADTPSYAKRFLEHWQPDLCLWFESDIWPNIIRASKARGAPMLLLNARFSQKSREGWMQRPKTAKALLSAFDDILPADESAAQFLSATLGRKIKSFGNLKRAAPPLPIHPQDAALIQAQLSSSHIWCAASTHKGEDEIILKAHKEVLKRCPKARLILVPRHPERADDMARLIGAAGLSYARWGEPLPPESSVYLADKMGTLGAIYAASDIALMGGSLLAHLNGHNPLEPAHMGCAVISGPNVSSFKQIYQDMSRNKAVKIIADVTPSSLAAQIIDWFHTPDSRAPYAKAAKTFSTDQRKLMTKLTAHLSPFILALGKLG